MAAKKQSSGKATKNSKAGTRAKKASARKPAAKKAKAAKKSANPGGATGLDKSVEHFRESLEHSVTLSRDRLQEVVDDAAKRGRMTRGDAGRMVSGLTKPGRRQSDSNLKDVERRGKT